MTIASFFQGIGIGFTLASAVGPIAILLTQRTLARGWRVGALSGVGVALADASYGLLGGLGLAAINQFLVDQQLWMRLIGGTLLVYIGVKIFRSVPTQSEAATEVPSKLGAVGAITSIYALTISNPLTIFSFAAVYTGINLGSATGTWQGAVFFAIAIFIGSMSWWLVLATIAHYLRERFNPTALRWLNRLSGGAIVLFGFWMIAQVYL